MSDDLISRQDVIDELKAMYLYHASEKWREEESDDTIKARAESCMASLVEMKLRIEKLPSAQSEHLADDDIETIRIHLSAIKESLCNQRRWKEAEDYERLINRFISFASAQPQQTCKYWDSESNFCTLHRPSAQPVTVKHELTEEEIKNIKQKMADSPLVLIPSAQPEPRWIPCSERLPEHGKSVLVTYVYNGKRFVAESWYIGQHDERGNPLFSSCADEYKASDLYFQKVAWMPLPEPWEGEQE